MALTAVQHPSGGTLGPLPRGNTLRRLRSGLPVVASFVAVIALWTVVTALRLAPADVLPPPGAVLSRAWDMIWHPYGPATLPQHAAVSILRVLAGYLLGCIAGLAIGILLKVKPVTRYALEPLFTFLRPIPAFGFITVLIIWLGIGEAPKVALIFIGVVAPMTVYTVAAMDALPPDLDDAARTLGATPRQLLLRVRLPAALPDILVGMRILLALAWTGVMGAELIAADSGLGWSIWHGMRYLQTDVIFVGIIAIAVIGAAMDGILILVAARLTGGWKDRMRGRE